MISNHADHLAITNPQHVRQGDRAGQNRHPTVSTGAASLAVPKHSDI